MCTVVLVGRTLWVANLGNCRAVVGREISSAPRYVSHSSKCVMNVGQRRCFLALIVGECVGRVGGLRLASPWLCDLPPMIAAMVRALSCLLPVIQACSAVSCITPQSLLLV